jgi:hypothetical protein
VLIVLAPLGACIAAGSVHASLWLDEIQYWFYERTPSLRALETNRPGSRIARYFVNYFYSDIQRLAHALMRPFGLTLQRDPELYLRLLSMISCAAAALFVYWFVSRDETRSWWWSVAAALAVAASPLLLYYAFEARVSAFATLGVIGYLALLAAALAHPDPKRFLIAGALFGIFLGHLHTWVACLFAGLCLAALIRFAIARQQRELWTIAAFTIPGAITAAAEAAYITFTYPPGGHGFPLYRPQPFGRLAARTISAISSTGLSTPPVFSGALALVLIIVAIGFLLFDLRRSPRIIFPLGALFSLGITIAIGTEAGYLIAPRYQAPLFGALFFSLAFAASQRARIAVALFAAIELALLPFAIRDISLKGNGRQIAALIASAPRTKTAVIIQQSLRLGYPDPLHNFALALYLNEQHPESEPMHLFELPALRDITTQEGVRDYFSGGVELRDWYASTPVAQWQQTLRAAPWDHIWLVTPVPRMAAEERQSIAFRETLAASGFVLQRAWLVPGYPMTQVGRFLRSDGHDAAAITELGLQRPADLGAVDKARHEDRHLSPGQR